MAYEWTSDLETGHALIDAQHKALFAAVNNFADAFRNNKGNAEIEKTLHFLINYSERHFRDEEELHKRYNIPDLARHRQYHLDFKKDVRSLMDRFEKEGPTDALLNEIYLSIRDWLLHHIKSDDFVMAAAVRERM